MYVNYYIEVIGAHSEAESSGEEGETHAFTKSGKVQGPSLGIAIARYALEKDPQVNLLLMYILGIMYISIAIAYIYFMHTFATIPNYGNC